MRDHFTDQCVVIFFVKNFFGKFLPKKCGKSWIILLLGVFRVSQVIFFLLFSAGAVNCAKKCCQDSLTLNSWLWLFKFEMLDKQWRVVFGNVHFHEFPQFFFLFLVNSWASLTQGVHPLEFVELTLLRCLFCSAIFLRFWIVPVSDP